MVLGAGASKAALLKSGRSPPLDADFLEEAWKLFARKKALGPLRVRIGAWRDLEKYLTGAGLKLGEVRQWRLEQLSTFLEARSSLHGLQLNRGRPTEYRKALDALRRVVCHVLELTGGTAACRLHKALFSFAGPASVISFNYDLIADQSLMELGLLRWQKAQYRGATTAKVLDPDNRQKMVAVGRPLQGKQSTTLIKLHGSMNFEKLSRGDGYRLSGLRWPVSTRQLEYVSVPDDPFIVPPVAAKIGIGDAMLRDRWKSALDELYYAPVWIIWGYSFPVTDTISQVLFREALRKNRKNKPVIVINPDHDVGLRVKDVCRKVNIHRFSSVERFLIDYKYYVFQEKDQ